MIPTCLELFIHLACGGDAGGCTALELNYPRATQHPCLVCHLGLFASCSIEQVGFIKKHYQAIQTFSGNSLACCLDKVNSGEKTAVRQAERSSHQIRGWGTSQAIVPNHRAPNDQWLLFLLHSMGSLFGVSFRRLVQASTVRASHRHSSPWLS